MIDDKVFAKNVSDMLLQQGKALDESLLLVKNNCSEEDFLKYRHGVSKVMGEILIELLNPIYKMHPDLKPPELV